MNMFDRILEVAQASKLKFAPLVGVNRRTLYNWAEHPEKMALKDCYNMAKALKINEADYFLALVKNDKKAFQRIKSQLSKNL